MQIRGGFCFVTELGLTGRVDSNSCGDGAEDGAKTAQWAVFSSAARDIHPRSPRTPVSEPGTGVSVLSVLQKGLQGWIRTASEPTAACGGNREARLGQRSAFSKPCQWAAEKAASATRKTRRTEKSPCGAFLDAQLAPSIGSKAFPQPPEKWANKNHRPGGWWFGDREKTGFALNRAGSR